MAQTFLPLFIFPYFDGLHSDFSVFSSLLQKRSHRLQLLLHLTHILRCAKKLPDKRTTGGHIRVLIKHTCMHTLKFCCHYFFQSSASPCPGQSSCADEHCTVLASCVQWELRRFWAVPDSSSVWRSYVEKAQPGTVHTSWLPSGGSSHTSMSGEGNQLRRDCA